MTSQVVVVTGAFGGIGEAICKRFVRAGCTVIGTCHHIDDDITAWKRRVEGDSSKLFVYQVSVESYASCLALAERARKEVGLVNVLVNNAGITRDVVFRKSTPEDWAQVMAVNLISVFNMTHALMPDLLGSRSGRIINISSVNAQRGSFGQTNYSASKAGIHGFTKSLALEVASKGVTVNTVSPGFIATRMTAAIPTDVLNTKILPQIPLGRLGNADEVASLIEYLASESAAYITGADISVNGGLHTC